MDRRYGYVWRPAAALMLALLAAGCAGSGGSTGPRTEIVPIQIDSAEVQVGATKPPQVQAVINGVVGDSCNKLEKVAQSRKGNEITIKITAVRTLDAPCMEYAKMYNEVIKLDGDFPAGNYTLIVNSVNKSFTVQ